MFFFCQSEQPNPAKREERLLRFRRLPKKSNVSISASARDWPLRVCLLTGPERFNRGGPRSDPHGLESLLGGRGFDDGGVFLDDDREAADEKNITHKDFFNGAFYNAQRNTES